MEKIIDLSMKRFSILLVLCIVVLGCNSKKKTTNYKIDREVLESLGTKPKQDFLKGVEINEYLIAEDSTNVNAYVGLAEAQIMVFAFGLDSRENTIPIAEEAFIAANVLDSTKSNVLGLSAKLHFINRNWRAAEVDFKKAITANPNNFDTRHWYALLLMATKRADKAFVQSDIIMASDISEHFLVARASLYYFEHRFDEMKPLMHRAIENDAITGWAYDWLGMAHNGLSEHEKSIEAYLKAFELADGTVEVGGGLGHALGDAGEIELAKEMTNYYDKVSKTKYLPPEQRAFIHISIKEYDKAITLLEEAYTNKSWFINFMQIEHWYDPIKNDQRFIDIMNKMNFPK